MVRLGFAVVIFLAGAGAGIYWGVHHPQLAADIAGKEQQQTLKIQAEVARAKIQLLDQFLGDKKPASGDVRQMKSEEQKKLDDANKGLASP
ncbi:MAG: hypothetical protein ABR964_13420 [Tepidisphaeraceae bacterium]|jgi:hypothetical protein